MLLRCYFIMEHVVELNGIFSPEMKLLLLEWRSALLRKKKKFESTEGVIKLYTLLMTLFFLLSINCQVMMTPYNQTEKGGITVLENSLIWQDVEKNFLLLEDVIPVVKPLESLMQFLKYIWCFRCDELHSETRLPSVFFTRLYCLIYVVMVLYDCWHYAAREWLIYTK